MKIYKIFKFTRGLAPRLYAITDSKSLYKNFKSVRDMKFFKVVEQEVSEEEWHTVNMAFYRYILQEVVYPTCVDGVKTVAHIVTNDVEDHEVNKMAGDIPFIMCSVIDDESIAFKKDLKDALSFFYYDIIRNNMSYVSDEENYDRMVYDVYLNDHLTMAEQIVAEEFKRLPEYDIDYLGIFIFLFGDTMKK